ncbi:MAG TPA: hypothetical protein VFO27_14125 [Bryobacteraceae bacterium]|nr:hypothetical protein [Bryobacteraceae bacterium]
MLNALKTTFGLLPHFTHPLGCPFSQLGMILIFPDWLIALEDPEQSPALDLAPRQIG